jgi:hypothetical protein
MSDLTFEQLGHLAEMPNSIQNLKKFVAYYMATRCPDFEPECPVCKAWASVDHLDRLVDEFVKHTNETQTI